MQLNLKVGVKFSNLLTESFRQAFQLWVTLGLPRNLFINLALMW